MLVLDSSVVLTACSAQDGFALFGVEELVATPLMWSEFRSVLHAALWRGEISSPLAMATLEALEAAPIALENPPQLGRTAWRIADDLGWARTYDAEHVALAQILGCPLVTLDRRLQRGAARLGFVITPEELPSQS